MVGTSTSVATDAERAAAPPVPLGAVRVKRTRIVSSVHVMLAVAGKFGQAAHGALEEKLAVPDVDRHSVTAPPLPTARSIPFTKPVPSPIVPLSDAGGVAVVDCAKPLTSTRLVSFSGSSIPTTVQVENEPLALTARCTPTK